MDLALHTLDQHGERIGHNADLSRRAQALQDRYRSPDTQVNRQHKQTALPAIESAALSC